MKYRIDKSDLLIENKLHSEGSVIELTKDQTKGIEDFLIPLNSHSERSEESKKEVLNKKTKTKSSVALAQEGKGNKK